MEDDTISYEERSFSEFVEEVFVILARRLLWLLIPAFLCAVLNFEEGFFLLFEASTIFFPVAILGFLLFHSASAYTQSYKKFSFKDGFLATAAVVGFLFVFGAIFVKTIESNLLPEIHMYYPPD